MPCLGQERGSPTVLSAAAARFRCVGFSVRLAPGVRIRASSRGVRTSLGPRVARVHVGAGRAGVSTGVGPVGFYTSLSGGRRSSSTRSRPRSSTSSATRSLAAAAKAQQVQQIAAVLQSITTIHQQEFAASRPPVAPEPPVPDLAAIRDRHRKSALAGIRFFDRAGRRRAREASDRMAASEFELIKANDQKLRAVHQADLDAAWQRLLANDEETVVGTLAEAFEDTRQRRRRSVLRGRKPAWSCFCRPRALCLSAAPR